MSPPLGFPPVVVSVAGKAVPGALAVIHLTNQRSVACPHQRSTYPTMPAATPPRPSKRQGAMSHTGTAGLPRPQASPRAWEEGKGWSPTTPDRQARRADSALHPRFWVPDPVTRLILDGSAAAFVVRDLSGRYLYGNRRAQLDMGSDEPLDGRTLRDVFSPELADIVSRRDHEVARTRHASTTEGTFVFPDGREHGVVFATHRVMTPDGTPLIVSVITERSGVRERSEPEIRFEQLIDSIEDVFVLSSVGPPMTLYASPNASDVYGLGSGPFTIASFLDAVHPEDRSLVVSTLRQLGPSQREAQVEYRVLHAERGTRWLRARVRPVEGPAGDRRMATIINDITEDRDLRQDLARAHDEAIAANARKDLFLSHISHELRTPLHAILGFTQLLEWHEPELAPEQSESVRQIQRAGQHLLDLINEILDIQQIERGDLTLSPESVDVEAKIDDTVNMLRAHANRHSITLTVAAPGQTVGVFVDRQRFTQVLINLINNGIKFNQPGGTVTVRWAPPSDGLVRIEIADDGIGIAEHELRQLFIPFERLERSAHIEGSGIGLALTRQLIEAMKGAISVESQLGKGTTFAINLPAAGNADKP